MDEVRLLLLKLRRLLRSRGRSIDDTEDLIQEAFLRLQVYCRDKNVAQTEAFLVRTALNLSIDQHTGDSEGFAQTVAQLYGLHVTQEGDAIHLRSAAPPAP